MRIWLMIIAIVWIIVIIWCIVEEIKYAKVIRECKEIIKRYNKFIEEYEKKYGNDDNDWK